MKRLTKKNVSIRIQNVKEVHYDVQWAEKVINEKRQSLTPPRERPRSMDKHEDRSAIHCGATWQQGGP
jgi:hypothetical protein